MKDPTQVVEWTHRAAVAIATVVLAGLSLLTFCDVIGRKVLNAPVPGTVELIQGLMALLMFGALATATHHDEHVRVDLLTQRFPAGVRRFLTKLRKTAVLVVMATIAWALGHHALYMLEIGDMTPVLRLPLYPFAFGAFALAACCVVIALSDLLRRPTDARSEGPV